MALFRVTVKRMNNTNGIRVEKGMSVEVVTNSLSNPLTTNGGQAVADAFYRIYGIMLERRVFSRQSIWMYNGLGKV